MFFVRKMLGAVPDSWQAKVLRALAQGKSIAVKSGHGVGKTALLSWTSIWFMATHPYARVPMTAPTFNQLKDVLMPEINKWLQDTPLESIFETTKTRMRAKHYPETWFSVARSSNNPDNMAGFHADDLLYIVDEAPGIDDEVMEVVDGALTNEGAIVVLAGNPVRRTGYFADLFKNPMGQFETYTVSGKDSPRVSQEYINRMMDKWGENSDVVRIRVKGEFPKSESDAFIPYNLCHSATLVDGDLDHSHLSLGVDVARRGRNDTVITARRGDVVVNLQEHPDLDTTDVAAEVWSYIRENRGDEDVIRVKIDDAGVGGGVTDRCREIKRELIDEEEKEWAQKVEIVPCNFGGSCFTEEQEEYYLNAGAAMWGNLKDQFQDDILEIPDDEELLAQLSTRHFKMTGRGKIKLESKEQMSNRGRPSPDKADSLALAFWEPPLDPDDEVDIVAPSGGMTQDSKWKQVV